MPSCSVCISEHRGFVEILAANGVSLDRLKQSLAEKNISLPTIGLKRHLREHSGIDLEKLHPSILEVMKKPRERAEDALIRREREAEAELVLATMIDADSVSIEAFRRECGIKETPETIDDVIGADQTVTYRLFQRAAAIADKGLELYARDRERYKYPSAQLKGLSMLHEMMATAYAYREAVNINAAARTIHREGGRVVFESADVAAEVADDSADER